MKTVPKVADRVVMLYPLARLGPDEPQVLFDGTPDGLRACADPRVRQFVEGEARDRLAELTRLSPALAAEAATDERTMDQQQLRFRPRAVRA